MSDSFFNTGLYKIFEPKYKDIVGKPFISVSAKGISNGLSNIPNDGADFGPDTMLNATSPNQTGPPYSQTIGILEAFNYAGNNGIGTVLLKSGTYNVQTWPTLTFSNITVKGEGIHATVIQISSTSTSQITSGNQTNVTFEDLDMIFTNPNSSGGIAMGIGQNLHNFTFRNMYSKAPGFQVGWITSNVSLTDLTTSNVNTNFLFEDCIFDASSPYTSSPNYMSVMGVDMKFIGCKFTTTTTTISNPIVSYGLSRFNLDGPHYFIGCTFDASAVYLILEQGYSPIIIGNSFLNGAAIATSENIDYPSNEAPNYGIRIIGNEFEGIATSSGGTQFITENNNDYGMIVVGNHFVNTSGLLYTNNVTYPIGIACFNALTNGIIEDNVFENMGNPIMADSSFKASIKNNVFHITLSQTGTNAGIVFVNGGIGFIDFAGNVNDGYNNVFYNGFPSSSEGFLHDNPSISFTPTTPTVPASGTAQENTNPYATNVYLYGGTVTEIQITKNGTAYTVFSNATGLALSGQVYKLNPNDSITITYTTAPTWEWLSD